MAINTGGALTHPCHKYGGDIANGESSYLYHCSMFVNLVLGHILAANVTLSLRNLSSGIN